MTAGGNRRWGKVRSRAMHKFMLLQKRLQDRNRFATFSWNLQQLEGCLIHRSQPDEKKSYELDVPAVCVGMGIKLMINKHLRIAMLGPDSRQ